jgi:hypothetical protein
MILVVEKIDSAFYIDVMLNEKEIKRIKEGEMVCDRQYCRIGIEDCLEPFFIGVIYKEHGNEEEESERCKAFE